MLSDKLDSRLSVSDFDAIDDLETETDNKEVTEPDDDRERSSDKLFDFDLDPPCEKETLEDAVSDAVCDGVPLGEFDLLCDACRVNVRTDDDLSRESDVVVSMVVVNDPVVD